jgi:hypothetical protein
MTKKLVSLLLALSMPVLAVLACSSESLTAIPSAATVMGTSLSTDHPQGFAALTDETLTLYTLDGKPLGARQLPGVCSARAIHSWRAVHVTSGLLTPIVELTVLYAVGEIDKSLKMSRADGVTVFAPHGSSHLVSVPGELVIAYGFGSCYTAENWLYVDSLDAFPTTAPITLLDNPGLPADGPWGMDLIALRAENGLPAGVWFQWEPVCTGGMNMGFAMRRGLSYMDLATGKITELLGLDRRPAGLSPDRSWAAHTSAEIFSENDLNAIPSPMTIRNLSTGVEVAFPLLVDSDRGAGDAAFSPDNRYLAWVERNGADPFTARLTIRVATLEGQIVAEIPAAQVSQVVGYEVGAGLTLAGWLDGETLLLQVNPGAVAQPVSLLRVRFDGSGLAYLAPGWFVEFLYP